MNSKNFKSKQVSLQLYEFSPKDYQYLRIDTLYRIMGEDDTPENAFKRIALTHDKKDKLFMMIIKNLEGVDMKMYAIKTNDEGEIAKIIKIVPKTIRMQE